MNNDEWGVIGGDFHYKNYLYKSPNKITLLDFDLCGYGWRAYDIAVFKWSLFQHKLKNKKQKEFLWKSFLDGYQVVRSLTDQELAIIDTFVQIRQIWLMGSHTTYSELNLDPKYWSNMFEQLKILSQIS